MPRFVKRSYVRRVRTSDRAARAQRLSRVRKNRFIDPFPNILGTVPEKMVYAQLSLRNIRFAFQNEVRFRIPEIKLIRDYRPDIIIPSLKIIIEVQGAYWHTKPEAIESDAFKYAVYQMTGWRVVSWWDFDIMSRIHELFAADPVLSKYPPTGVQRQTEYVYTEKIIRNDTKGIATMNRNRGLRQAWKRPPVRVRL